MVDADAPTGAGPGKLTTLSEAVAAHIHDGDCVAVAEVPGQLPV